MLEANDIPLRYWRSDDGSRGIEFLVDIDAHAAPIEVKAKRGSTASLNAILADPEIMADYKIGAGNVGRDGKKLTLPCTSRRFCSNRSQAAGDRGASANPLALRDSFRAPSYRERRKQRYPAEFRHHAKGNRSAMLQRGRSDGSARGEREARPFQAVPTRRRAFARRIVWQRAVRRRPLGAVCSREDGVLVVAVVAIRTSSA